MLNYYLISDKKAKKKEVYVSTSLIKYSGFLEGYCDWSFLVATVKLKSVNDIRVEIPFLKAIAQGIKKFADVFWDQAHVLFES